MDNRAILGPNILNPDTDSIDCNGHGTHVAALAVGAHSGVATEAKAISVKVLDCQGKGSCVNILSGMEWVAKDSLMRRQRGERSVLVMSVGSTSGECLATLEAARRLWDAGVFVAAAAGNRNSDACELYPARSAHTIAVGAVDSEDRYYAKNNMGSCVDIFAPGVDIVSAGSLGSNSEMELKSGTSMATPLVGGTAALILGARWTLSANDIKEVLISSSTKNKVLNRDGKTVMTAAKNRLLYAPWGRLFSDIRMNVEAKETSRYDKFGLSRKKKTDHNSSSTLMSVSLTLTPGISPAMTYSTTQIRTSLARQTGVKEQSIVVRRDVGVSLYSNGSEPSQIRLKFYIPTDPKVANMHASQIKKMIASGRLRANSFDDVALASVNEAVRLNVTLPEAAGEAFEDFEERVWQGKWSGSLNIILRTLLVVGILSVVVFLALCACVIVRRRRESRNLWEREGDGGLPVVMAV
ncbi:unnamed protein product [Agarophyton chilense]